MTESPARRDPAQVLGKLTSLIPTNRDPIRDVVSALVCVAVAAAVRAALGTVADDIAPYATFFPAVAVAVLVSGVWAGVMALVLGSVVGWALFSPDWEITQSGLINLALYLFSAGAVLLIAAALKRVLDRLKANEGILRTSADHLDRAQTAGGIGHWELDVASGNLTWSDSAYLLLGLAPSAAKTGLTEFSQLIHPNDRARVAAELTAMIEKREQLETEFRVVWPDGSVHWLAARGEFRRLQGGIEKLAGISFEISDFKRLEADLRLSERRYRQLVSSSSSIVWLSDAFGNVTQPIPSYEHFTGTHWPHYKGKAWRGAFHEEDASRVERDLSSATSLGKEFETSGRLWNEPTAAWRWVHVRAVPLYDEAGRVGEWIGSITDVHDLQTAHEQQGILINELRHRIKNTLAVVQALATQSRRYSSGDPMASFLSRLHAMARAHDLIMATGWADVLLSDIIKQAVKPFAAFAETDHLRIGTQGPTVRISANTSVYIALAFYELATNATRYGALSTPSGHVDVAWRREDGPAGPRIVVDWRESGGPALDQALEKRGLGLRLIENAVSREPGGTAEVLFEKTGLVCRMSFLEMKRPAMLTAAAS